MKTHNRHSHVMAAVLIGTGAVFGAFAVHDANAQDWPTRAIEIAVFSSAGGGTDQTNRVLAAALEDELGAEIRVANMTGGRGGVAAHYVYSGPKDGHRWLGASATLQSMAVRGAHPTTHEDWHYYLLSASPSILAVPVDSPYETFGDLYEYVQDNPGRLRLSPISAGAPTHILMEALRSEGDFDYNFIPYDGSYPTMVAAVAGEVEAVVIPLTEASGYIRDGHLRPLVILEAEAYEFDGTEMPPITDWVPEMSRYLPLPVWFGFMVPGDTPDHIIERIDEAFANIQDRPEIVQFLENTNTDALGLYGSEAKEMAKRQEQVHSWVLYDLELVTISPEDFGIERP